VAKSRFQLCALAAVTYRGSIGGDLRGRFREAIHIAAGRAGITERSNDPSRNRNIAVTRAP
jgi:hypothetical protein